jgi:hypothetical protein
MGAAVVVKRRDAFTNASRRSVDGQIAFFTVPAPDVSIASGARNRDGSRTHPTLPHTACVTLIVGFSSRAVGEERLNPSFNDRAATFENCKGRGSLLLRVTLDLLLRSAIIAAY